MYKKKKTYVKKRPPMQSKSMHLVARQEARKALRQELETKYTDYVSTTLNIDATSGQVIELTGNLVKGTAAENDYIGSNISPKGLYIRGNILVGDTYNVVRALVIQTKAGGTPVISSIFDIYGSIRAPYSFLNEDYKSTYHLLYDRTFRLVDGNDSAVHAVHIKIPARRLKKVTFLTGGSARTSGALWLVLLSDSTASAHPSAEVVSRIYYTDA